MGETSAFIDGLFSSAWGIFLVLLFFNGSIVVHELGHYLAARWRGLKVERFSLFGLGPKLVSWRGKDGVEYCLCAIPFGAYVALPQLAEMRALEGDGEDPAADLPPISYADKMYVAFAGPFFNLLLAIVVALLGWWTGYPSFQGSESARIGYVAPQLDIGDGEEIPGPAALAGLRPGDNIIAIDGDPIDTFKQVSEHVALGTGRSEDGLPRAVFTIQRDGETMDIEIFPALSEVNAASGDRIRMIGIGPTNSLAVGHVMEHSPAERAGLQVGDVIVAVEGQAIYSTPQISDLLNERPGQAVPVAVERNGEPLTLDILAEPVPQTKPLARLTLADGSEPAFEIIPLYEPGLQADPAAADTPSQLAVFALEPGRALLASDGDWRITEVNGQAMASLAALSKATAEVNPEQELLLTFENAEGIARKRTLPPGLHLSIVPPQKKVMLGFVSQPDFILVHDNPLAQFEEHVTRTFRTLGSLLSPRSDIGLQHLSGPVGITTNLYRIASFDWRLALWFAVLLNINLAILNLLPVPVLDGGHMLFATISKLRGKPLPTTFIASVQGAFMFLLLGVMCYVLFFDSLREVGYHQERKDIEREAHYYIPIEFRPDRSVN